MPNPTITFEPINTVSRNDDLRPITEDKNHAQDWSVTTEAKDTWANRERRRSSVWSKVDDVDVTANNPKRLSATGGPRRGSILSVWSAGKDKMGRDILVHDDEDMGDESAVAESDKAESEKAESEQGDPDLLRMLGREKRTSYDGAQRRGSILSLWSGGKDEKGRDIVVHDDEEWKV